MKTNLHDTMTQSKLNDENIEKLVEDRKIIEEFGWIRRKIENLTSTIMAMKHGDTVQSVMNTKANNFDKTKFVDYTLFADYQKHQAKLERETRRMVDDLRRLVEDVAEVMKVKVNEADLKVFQGYFLTRIYWKQIGRKQTNELEKIR